MTSRDPLRDSASALAEAAGAFHRAAHARGSHVSSPEALESLQEALQVLSAAWYALAADAAGDLPHRDGLSREQEVRLMGALHDVAAAFARCARASREGRSTVAPIVARSVGAGQAAAAARPDGELSWFASTGPRGEVA